MIRMTHDDPPGLSPASRARLDALLVRELAAHGHVRPPWQLAPAQHPASLFWRMGSGEGQLVLFDAWWQALAPDEPTRLDWVRRWQPPPLWYPWAGSLLGPGDDEDDLASVERLEAAGLGTVADWQAAMARPAGG